VALVVVLETSGGTLLEVILEVYWVTLDVLLVVAVVARAWLVLRAKPPFKLCFLNNYVQVSVACLLTVQTITFLLVADSDGVDRIVRTLVSRFVSFELGYLAHRRVLQSLSLVHAIRDESGRASQRIIHRKDYLTL